MAQQGLAVHQHLMSEVHLSFPTQQQTLSVTNTDLQTYCKNLNALDRTLTELEAQYLSIMYLGLSVWHINNTLVTFCKTDVSKTYPYERQIVKI